jgi:DnaA-homolog protein
MSAQLSLAVSLRNDATFANFLATDTSRSQAKQLLVAGTGCDTHLVYLWGGNGAGVSHFAQAACNAFFEARKTLQYLPLADLIDIEVESMLDGLERQELLCLDGIHSVSGNPQWERALFNLYNKLVNNGHLLLVTADMPPAQLAIVLPDLASRLASGITFHFAPYGDVDKIAILKFRAARLGLDLADDVAAYILNRCSRELDDLMAVLLRLDAASLEAKRRITIPFVKTIFGW